MPSSLSEDLDFEPGPAMLAAALDASEELGAASGGAVTAATRRTALRAFRAFGPQRNMPARWRHDYAALDFTGLQWSTGRMRVPALPRHVPSRTADIEREERDAPALAVENAGGLVHLGSTYLEPQERLGDPRVTLLSLADAYRSHASALQAIHGRIVDAVADRFAALSMAFQNCGAYVDVPAGLHVDAPLQIVWSARPGEPQAVFPHTVVRVGAHARATVLERHLGSSESFVDGIVEVELERGARLDYVVVQEADDGARLFFRRAARCGAGAAIGWHVADLGGALVRASACAGLQGDGARAEINAFFFARAFAHVDWEALLDHAAPRTHSLTTVRSAATGRGQGRFSGAVRIRPDAHEAEASMRDDALVLSRDAHLDATPALEIAAHDVRAFHAATVGSLDEDQLFYVQARGIARGRAERMIALAFFEPAIGRFPGEALRDEVRTALDGRLDELPETFS
jgi:Fe-S cluster assembly protein SufD